MEKNCMVSFCAVVPVYNHERAVTSVVTNIMAHDIFCILVDDGSEKACASVLDNLSEKYQNRVHLVRHAINMGKGKAIITGMRYAKQLGFTHAIQIDADGQHNTDDIPLFIDHAKKAPHSVINGCPIYDESVPTARYFCRYITHIWVWINTLSFAIKDSMCGFRLYPLEDVIKLDHKHPLSSRMTCDIDIIVRLFWEGVRIINLPTKVTYPADGVSHFKVVRDNVQISCLHARLFFGMLIRLPRLIGFWWQK